MIVWGSKVTVRTHIETVPVVQGTYRSTAGGTGRMWIDVDAYPELSGWYAPEAITLADHYVRGLGS
jgi:hypothetical protein